MTTVREIMQTDLRTVRPDTSVLELARLLSDRGISGVPVIDRDERLVGVVSATDVVRLAAEETEVRSASACWAPLALFDTEGDPEDERESSPDYFLPEEGTQLLATWDEASVNTALEGVSVGDIMTPVSFTISPDAPVEELAEFLVRGRIHRALVEEDRRLAGIVTTFDLLRVVAGGRFRGTAA